MLKFLSTIAVVLWIFVGMAELLSLAPPTVNQTPVNSGETKKADKCGEENNPSLIRMIFCDIGGLIDVYHDNITAASTLVIAAFTVILGIFTMRLAKSTRIAADAAKDTAAA